MAQCDAESVRSTDSTSNWRMDEVTNALVTGFMFGCLLNALMYWLLNKRYCAQQRKPGPAGWRELQQSLEAMNGKEQKHANENPRGAAQRSDIVQHDDV